MQLKRRSQQLLEKMQIVDIDIDEVDAVNESSGEEDNTQTLNRKITRTIVYHYSLSVLLHVPVDLPYYVNAVFLRHC